MSLRRRGSSLGPTEMYLLNHWAGALCRAFADPDGHLNHPYLVGSAARGEAFRDVDVRLMLDDDEFERVTGGSAARLAALNVAFTLWGQQATGLPIDFQLQDTTATNAEHNGVRNALGIGFAPKPPPKP